MQQVPACCCVSTGSGEAAGTGQRCLRAAKGLPPHPPPTRWQSLLALLRVLCYRSAVPAWCLVNDAGIPHLFLGRSQRIWESFSGRGRRALCSAGGFRCSPAVPWRGLQARVNASAAVCLAEELPRAWAELLGVSVGLVCCIVCPAAKIHARASEVCSRELLHAWSPGAARGRVPGLASVIVDRPCSGRSLAALVQGHAAWRRPCCFGGAPCASEKPRYFSGCLTRVG